MSVLVIVTVVSLLLQHKIENKPFLILIVDYMLCIVALLVFGFQFSSYTPVLYHAYICTAVAVVSVIGLVTVLRALPKLTCSNCHIGTYLIRDMYTCKYKNCHEVYCTSCGKSETLNHSKDLIPPASKPETQNETQIDDLEQDSMFWFTLRS